MKSPYALLFPIIAFLMLSTIAGHVTLDAAEADVTVPVVEVTLRDIDGDVVKNEVVVELPSGSTRDYIVTDDELAAGGSDVLILDQDLTHAAYGPDKTTAVVFGAIVTIVFAGITLLLVAGLISELHQQRMLRSRDRALGVYA